MSISSFIIFIFLILKTSDARQRIVGGSEASIEKVPYQVALLYYEILRCGGSIVSCKHVLTAAHCTSTITELSPLSIRAGSSNFTGGGSLHEIIKIDIHPNYDRFLYDFDASILTLKSKIIFDLYRQPIQLPFQYEALPAGSIVLTSGWGFTQKTNDVETLLRMVELKVVRQIDCFKAFMSDGGVTTRMVCASALAKDACDGDSGGPLVDVKTGKIVGIVSFGPVGSCAVEGTPGVYARVASFRSWIREIIKF